MYLDQRGHSILKEILNNPAITGSELEETLTLTRKQIRYSLCKINDYLEENGFEAIRWLKTGRFLISLSVIREFQSQEEKMPGAIYVCSDEERGNWILLRLLCHNEELSTYHFTDELKISKNTLMSDLKRIRDIVSEYGLEVSYNRKTGYQLAGSEYEKRGLMIQVLRRILGMPGGEKQLCYIYGISGDELAQKKDDIRTIEENLQVTFTDERINELPYILTFILLSIGNGSQLDCIPEVFHKIVGTKEYAVMSSFCSKYGITDEQERIFFTVQIQISNIHSLKEESQIHENLIQASEQIVRNFEQISCTKIVEKGRLLEALAQHLGPAFYRIKYQYHVQPDISDMILPKYQYIHEMVKLSAEPFEKMISQQIPDRELIYITALIGAWLKKEGTLENVWPRKKAVIVCSNGVALSNFLYVTLKEMFPQINFVACLSARGFYQYKKEFHVVFTTVRLDTDKKQFVVSTGFNEYKKNIFHKKVLSELDGIGYKNVTVEGIMSLVEKYATIDQRNRLVKELSQYLNPPEKNGEGEKKSDIEITLKDMLPVRNICFVKNGMDWKEAIRLSAAPLWEDGSIESGYIDRMIQIILSEKPYIMLADGIIVAHAGIEDGVVKPGMTLLRLPYRININDYMEADVIVVLATPDKIIHLNALYQLIHLLEEPDNLNFIRNSEKEEELKPLIDMESDYKL